MNLFHDVKIARNSLSISHLFYANNIMIFLRANIREAVNIQPILDNYCLWSVQSINFKKSSFFFLETYPPFTETKNLQYSAHIQLLLPYVTLILLIEKK